MSTDVSAAQFIEKLETYRSEAELEKIQRAIEAGKERYVDGGVFMGVFMGNVFKVAKEFLGMPLDELEKLLDSPVHEVRAGALSIMGKQAVAKKTTDDHRERLYELYLRHTDRINTWDLVDISCHQVIGAYLLDKPRDVLYKLVGSDRWWERRMAIVSTLPLIKAGDLDDTFRLAEALVDDEHHFVHTAVGWMLREAGKHDRARLLRFLDEHAATAPRVLLRYAIEHLDPDVRKHYLNLKKQRQP